MGYKYQALELALGIFTFQAQYLSPILVDDTIAPPDSPILYMKFSNA
jgi:hypothetical protein